MKLTPHRGVDLKAGTGIHLHVTDEIATDTALAADSIRKALNSMATARPRPTRNPALVTLLSEGATVSRIQLSPTEVEITSQESMGHLINTINVHLPPREMDRLLNGGAQAVDFLKDAVDNYEDDLSKDFVKGVKAAMEILTGKNDLEDYL